MDKIKEALWNWAHPQLFSLFITVLICFILALAVFIQIKRSSKPDKAPGAFLLIVEGYIGYIDQSFDEATEGKIRKTRVYIFALATFLLVGNLLGLIGLEPVVTSYSVPFTLALITWIGIYVVGLLYQKWRFFKKYINPIESIGQFAPLISLSFRIFGNIIGGSSILFLAYYVFGYLWTLIPGQENNMWFFFAPIFTSFLHLYFDVFGAFIQALIFTTLTVIYWTGEADSVVKKKKNKQKNIETIATQANIY
ncbi:F0F1 ATP synthase subunit A [Mycoplasmopsis columbina]|uniref:F0F1 ATP synthase subunit A n=1 Tax=Mycoplasmopsis columbina SF7 TaxID=1037410 RepID=F9UJR1_9BACT|nr:F0F1 ATP synthase subunit A [Mycoplasmopsis columbina]EGV00442.1 F0F1 ATP synthase subunit A [Mycoplasmopsis columbina SF7]VEU76693.1 F0F1 ATP synthase subunit A [Mycoplasmopsis columbina]